MLCGVGRAFVGNLHTHTVEGFIQLDQVSRSSRSDYRAILLFAKIEMKPLLVIASDHANGKREQQDVSPNQGKLRFSVTLLGWRTTADT